MIKLLQIYDALEYWLSKHHNSQIHGTADAGNLLLKLLYIIADGPKGLTLYDSIIQCNFPRVGTTQTTADLEKYAILS